MGERAVDERLYKTLRTSDHHHSSIVCILVVVSLILGIPDDEMMMVLGSPTRKLDLAAIIHDERLTVIYTLNIIALNYYIYVVTHSSLSLHNEVRIRVMNVIIIYIYILE